MLYTVDHRITAVRGQRTHILSIVVCSPVCSTAYLVSTSRKVGRSTRISASNSTYLLTSYTCIWARIACFFTGITCKGACIGAGITTGRVITGTPACKRTCRIIARTFTRSTSSWFSTYSITTCNIVIQRVPVFSNIRKRIHLCR